MDETTAPATAGQAALDALADARVSASLVILALVAFVAWRLVLRRRRLASAPARPSMPRSLMHRLPSSSAVRALTARVTGRLSAAADAARSRTGLQLRWGRTALFAAALAALLVFLVAGVAAALGAGTLALAGWSLLVALAGLAGLRALAVRDRVRPARPATLVPAAPAAETPEAPAAPRADPERDRRVLETVLAFETEAPHAAAPTEAPSAEPVVVTASAAPAAERAVTIPAVPRPTYLDAPEMVRPLPAPLEAPAAGSDVRLTDAVRAADEQISAAAEQDIAALDLDNVLARRRAS